MQLNTTDKLDCESVVRSFYGGVNMCKRPSGHFGQHQEIVPVPEDKQEEYYGILESWSTGGGSGRWLKRSEESNSFNCKRCGIFCGGWNSGMKQTLENHCFMCVFWWDLSLNDSIFPEKAIVIKGHHYQDGGRNKAKVSKAGYGFGGSKHVIKFFDGREIESYDLWTQGEIPQEWLEYFPNNAEFA